MKRIFRRKTTKINSKKVKDLKVDLNKIGAGVQLEEAVEDGEDEASGSGISTDLNNIGADVQLEEAVEDGEDEASGSGISTESYDDGAKKNN